MIEKGNFSIKIFNIRILILIFIIVVLYASSYSLLTFFAKKTYKAGDYLRAEKYYSIIIRLNPWARTAFAKLGYIELTKNKSVTDSLRTTFLNRDLPDTTNTVNQSIKYTERAIRLGLNEKWVYTNAAVAYDNLFVIQSRKSGSADSSKAILYYNKVLEIDPEDANAYNGVGSIYYQEKKYNLAIESLKKAAERKTDDARIQALIGFSYAELKNYKIAISYLEKAIELKYKNYPFPFLIHRYKGYSHFYLKDYNSAIKEYTKSLEFKQTSAAYLYRGLSYLFREEGRGDLEKAQNDFEEYLRLRPDGSFSKEVKSELEKIKLKLK